MKPEHSVESRVSARVLVLSMFFAPCQEVGGKRFSFLSRYLSSAFPEYHVLARKERQDVADRTAFSGNVHRCRMVPWFPPTTKHGAAYRLRRIWAKWICQIDPYIGWVLPAVVRGIRLIRKHDINVVIVTVPAFSAALAALMIARMARVKLILDYRDEWTNNMTTYRKPFGRYLSKALERAAVSQASAIVLCTDVMRRDFEKSFGELSSAVRTVIYNGFEHEEFQPNVLSPRIDTNMIYAGNLYGNRQLSVIAPALRELMRTGDISARTFRLHVFARLSAAQRAEIRKEGLEDIVQIHNPVSYDEIRGIFKGADILFLPSGDEVNYAVPFKFFDYLAARRPIFAVASRASAVYELMQSVDCGVFAEIGNQLEISAALSGLVANKKSYTFDGIERFMWQKSAARYASVIEDVAID